MKTTTRALVALTVLGALLAPTSAFAATESTAAQTGRSYLRAVHDVADEGRTSTRSPRTLRSALARIAPGWDAVGIVDRDRDGKDDDSLVTLTYHGLGSCVDLRAKSATGKPCRVHTRVDRTPLQSAAKAFDGRLRYESSSVDGPNYDPWELFELVRVASELPVTLEGVEDEDGDLLDDDGRVTLRMQTRVVCLTLGNTPQEAGRVTSFQPCSTTRAPRRSHVRSAPDPAVRAAYEYGFQVSETAASDRTSALSVTLLSRLAEPYRGAYEVTNILDGDGDGNDDDGKVGLSVADDAVRLAACVDVRSGPRVSSGPCR